MKVMMTGVAILCFVLSEFGFGAVDAQEKPLASKLAESQASDSDAALGPNGGQVSVVQGMQLETLVSTGGIKIHVTDSSGKSVGVDQVRGVVMLSATGDAKRYRYDLLSDGKGALVARANLTQLVGQKIKLESKLVGLSGKSDETLVVSGTFVVPGTEKELAAAAIQMQKICPVSNKPLGSMGDPVAFEEAGLKVYLCCAGCVNAVKADPAKYLASQLEVTVAEVTKADKSLVAKQANCPVMDEPLDSMGGPVKLLVGEKPVFLCCKGCIKKVKAEPFKYVSMLYGSEKGETVPAGADQVREGVYKVSKEDDPFIAAQKKCPVMDEPLDAMGGPYKVDAAGKAIYICCPGCAKRIAADPDKYLKVLADQGVTAPKIR